MRRCRCCALLSSAEKIMLPPLHTDLRGRVYSCATLYHPAPTSSPLTSQKNFPRNTGLQSILPGLPSLMYSLTPSTASFSSEFLKKQSQTLQVLESILPRTLSFKLPATDVFSMATAPSYHKTLTTTIK